ncbi:MAG: hypothetical protein ACKPKF_21910, partial [Microcystis panniformis]
MILKPLQVFYWVELLQVCYWVELELLRGCYWVELELLRGAIRWLLLRELIIVGNFSVTNRLTEIRIKADSSVIICD